MAVLHLSCTCLIFIFVWSHVSLIVVLFWSYFGLHFAKILNPKTLNSYAASLYDIIFIQVSKDDYKHAKAVQAVE